MKPKPDPASLGAQAELSEDSGPALVDFIDMKNSLVRLADSIQWEIFNDQWRGVFSTAGGPMANSGGRVAGSPSRPTVYHRLPERIRAHASICFIALIIYRVMRQRLKQSDCSLSPERALQSLRRIQRHKFTLNDKAHSGISTLSKEQGSLLDSLSVVKPTESRQLSLL